jgi:hypothetical protein
VGSTTVGPLTPAQDPAIETTRCSLSGCGTVLWQVNYMLPNPAANSGWIVQQITDNLSDDTYSTAHDQYSAGTEP